MSSMKKPFPARQLRSWRPWTWQSCASTASPSSLVSLTQLLAIDYFNQRFIVDLMRLNDPHIKTKSFWLDRPTLVTGATGLVGGWLVRHLLDGGADVVCLVRDWVPQSELVRERLLEQVKVVRGDVRDQAMIERTLGEYEIDTVIHLAAQTIVGIANRNPVSTFETNIAGTWCVLEACRRSPKVKQIVLASSDKAYGDQEQLPYDETTPLQGPHPYDVSKSCADLIAQSYATTYRLPVAITRCGNFYGGGGFLLEHHVSLPHLFGARRGGAGAPPERGG